MKKYKMVCFGLVAFFAMILGGFFSCDLALAITVSPMKQVIALTPGEEYTGKIKVYAERSSTQEEQFYEISIAPLSVNDTNGNYVGIFNKLGENNEIVNWVKLSDKETVVGYEGKLAGSIARDDSKELYFTINVPKEARGGGQYFAVMVKQVKDPNRSSSGNVAIEESIGIASAVYVEVSGDITMAGEINDNNISSFLLDSPITASFSAKNDGNSHLEVMHFLQVYPLFSDEELYTTEEEPGSEYVLPGTTRYVKQKWDETPLVGIFRVRQTVYFNSMSNEPSVTEKIVVKCPVWLLFLIVFGVVAIVIYFVVRAKIRKSDYARRGRTEA